MKNYIEPKVQRVLDTYLENIFQVCYNDCYDSNREVEKCEYAFEVLMDNEIPIKKYIEDNYIEEYVKAWQDFYNENLKDSEYFMNNDEAIREPDWGDLPIEFDKIEKFVKL